MARPKKIPNLAENIKPGAFNQVMPTDPSSPLDDGSNPSDAIICPIIQIANEKHALQKMWDGGNFPAMKAVGFARLSPDSNQWVSYVATIKGDRVLKIEIDEPNMRQIAEESAKVSFITELADKE